MKNSIVSILIFLIGLQTYGQDLSALLDEQLEQTEKYVTSTFKGTRIINGQSIENRKKGTLEFVISHRFGRVNRGIDDLFGLDQSNIRFAFEYAVIDDLTVGVGRSSFDKTYDGFLKYKLLKQKAGKESFPFTASLFGSVAYKTLKDFDPANPRSFNEKLSYVSQILIARKFNNAFSMQITPTFIHFNSVRISEDPHDIFALGVGTRLKLSNRISINAEYFYAFDEFESINTENSIAFGVDIETGGHVFQIILSNAITMIEKSFITETEDNFFDGDIHLGFNISRAFQVGSKGKRKLKKLRKKQS